MGIGILCFVALFCASGGVRCVDHVPRAGFLEVQRVIDGDTVVLSIDGALPAPLGNTLSLRILHVDAAEIHTAHCAAELALALAARDFVQLAVNGGVTLVRVCTWDKYRQRATHCGGARCPRRADPW
jgi:endonuclease YncB( thermonuclease family)